MPPIADVGERDPRRLAGLAERVAERLERGDDLALRRADAADGPAGDAATPAAATFSLSSKMIRSASFLPMPGIDDEHGLVLGHDRELEVGGRAAADDRERDLRPDPGHRQQQVEEAELLGGPEAVQRLLVLADEVVRVELEPAARRGRGEDRRRREHPVADPADLDDERIGRDRADDALDRGDHRPMPSGRAALRGALGGAFDGLARGERLADGPLVARLARASIGAIAARSRTAAPSAVRSRPVPDRAVLAAQIAIASASAASSGRGRSLMPEHELDHPLDLLLVGGAVARRPRS